MVWSSGWAGDRGPVTGPALNIWQRWDQGLALSLRGLVLGHVAVWYCVVGIVGGWYSGFVMSSGFVVMFGWYCVIDSVDEWYCMIGIMRVRYCVVGIASVWLLL